MDLIKKLIELVYYYRKDQGEGKPYWQDPTVIALGVSMLATMLAKAAGIDIGSDLQLKIVGVATGIGALLSPHTGVVQKTVAGCGSRVTGQEQTTKTALPLDFVEQHDHNLTSLS